jgi:colanic acid/amylovoran biosynthesis glycosyltransferase
MMDTNQGAHDREDRWGSLRPRRIAYFVNRFPNTIEAMIYREVNALRAGGTDVVIFSIRRPDWHEVPVEAHGLVAETRYILPIPAGRLLRTHVATFARRPGRYWRTLRRVLTGSHARHRDRLRSLCHFVEAVAVLPELQRLGADHVHAHWAVGSATVALVISELMDRPFTFTAHAYDIWRDRLLLPEKLRAAAGVVTCTDYARRHLAETYDVDPAKLHVVHHGVDLDRFDAVERRPNEVPVVLAVGRLVEQKGFDRLLDACAALTAAGWRFNCDIVGDGPLRDALERQRARLGLVDRVRFRGSLLQEALLHEYARADLFALPCRRAADDDRDGIPNTLMEAMAMELPVVSTAFSGIPELVVPGESGLLVDPDDLDGLVRAMAALLRSEDVRRCLGRAGRERVQRYFGLARSAAAMDALFTRVLEGAASHGEGHPRLRPLVHHA